MGAKGYHFVVAMGRSYEPASRDHIDNRFCGYYIYHKLDSV